MQNLNHPNYQLMELKTNELQYELKSSSREALIEWLCWNDKNGVYRDEDSIKEFRNILGKTEAIEIITRQIAEA